MFGAEGHLARRTQRRRPPGQFQLRARSILELDQLTGLAITFGGRMVELTAESTPEAAASPRAERDPDPASVESPHRWRAAFRIDGVAVEPPTGWSGYLGNQINALVNDPTAAGQCDDRVTLVYQRGPKTYKLSITFDANGDAQILIKAGFGASLRCPG